MVPGDVSKGPWGIPAKKNFKLSGDLIIAHNNYYSSEFFEVNDETGEMVKTPVDPRNWNNYIPYDWEILDSFFINHDIVPVWINCHSTWGWYDQESGKWTGAVGKVNIYNIIDSDNIIFEDWRWPGWHGC